MLFAIRRGGEREYSLTRAIAAELSGNWSEAGFEREVAQFSTRAVGKSASGFYVPLLCWAVLAITTATAPALIGTEQMSSAFIDALRPEVQVMALPGATTLPWVQVVALPIRNGAGVGHGGRVDRRRCGRDGIVALSSTAFR